MAPVQGPAGQRASIAVVGSGIAGLSAAYLLSEKFDVTLFEAHDRPGMDAYSVTIPRQHGLPPFRMDAPLRVFSRTFYPRLTALYEHIGVPFEETNYHLCVSRPSEPAFFRYVCLRIGRFGIALPWLSIRAALFHGMKAVRVLIGAARFWWHGPADLRRGALDGITLGEYTKQRAFSDTFVRDALLPMLSAVCTCSYEAVLLYPAAIVVDYLTVKHSATSAPWHRARHLRVTCGICEVAERLASACHSIQNGTSVVAVRGAGQGGRRRPAVLSVPTRSRKAGGSDDGPVPLPRAGAEPREQEFDHVVVATQAHHAAELLGEAPAAATLRRIPFQQSRVVVHRDVRLMPTFRQDWSPMNLTPSATVWMNAVVDDLAGPLFQSWNPHVEPDSDLVESTGTFHRPVMTLEALKAIDALGAHQGAIAGAGEASFPQGTPACSPSDWARGPGEGNLWFVGAFARRAVPLLESGVATAAAVATRLRCELPVALREATLRLAADA